MVKKFPIGTVIAEHATSSIFTVTSHLDDDDVLLVRKDAEAKSKSPFPFPARHLNDKEELGAIHVTRPQLKITVRRVEKDKKILENL